MADTIVLHLHDSQISRVSWLPLGKNSSPQSPRGTGTLEEAAEKLKGWRLVVIAPACDVLLTEVSIPSKNRQQLLQAIPYALENDLSEEIEQLHFAIDYHSDQAATPVAVISRQRLEMWLERLRSLDLQPLAIYPDLLCLPLTNGHWTIHLEPQYNLLRMGRSKGFCSDFRNFSALLKMSLEQSPSLPECVDFYVASGVAEEFSSSLKAGISCDVQKFDCGDDASAFLVGNLDEKHTLNLLQGEYKQIDQKTVQWRRWLPAGALFTLLIGINILSSVIDYAHYKAQSVALQNEIHRVFRETFPETKRIVDARVQMEQQLRSMRGDKDGDHATFLELISQPAITLAKIQGVQLDSLSFRDNQLDLKLTLKDLQSLEKIKTAIETNPGLSVEIKSANATGSQVSSHLRIKRGRI
ncbi:MAG: type II secretion system protein GspL [Chromatiales bacterium]